MISPCKQLTYFWFRRDLRLTDNIGLTKALEENNNVQCIFIFDENIIRELPDNDARITFIYDQLENINKKLTAFGASLLVVIGNPLKVWEKILSKEKVNAIYSNKDYEPYARERDRAVLQLAQKNTVDFIQLKDQVIFEEYEITKNDSTPYTVYTPYKNKWLKLFDFENCTPASINELTDCFSKRKHTFPRLEEIGFQRSLLVVKPYNLSGLAFYKETRDFPGKNSTSNLSPHLRFGTIGIRELATTINGCSEEFLNELIWREFFKQILFHFPKVLNHSFRSKYDAISWRNNTLEFEKWCSGKTGYPLVDAGMRQLNETGYMHNRVRMVAASFLCKHLLIDWRWGEAYFAEKLLDYDLSANNGNWQWAAGTGCDAAPYFRIFNPESQLKKFDPKLQYVRKWIKNFDEHTYPKPMVEHKFARQRALATYKSGLKQ